MDDNIPRKYMFRKSIAGTPIEKMPDEYYRDWTNRNYLIIDNPSDPDNRQLYLRKMELHGVSSAIRRILPTTSNAIALPEECDDTKFIGVFIDRIPYEDFTVDTENHRIVLGFQSEEKEVIIWYTQKSGKDTINWDGYPDNNRIYNSTRFNSWTEIAEDNNG